MFVRAALAGLSLVTLGACSTIVEGSSQNVTVMTDPSGASCRLESNRGIVGIVNPTPGSIQLEKSKDNVTVLCEKEGYQPSAGTLASSFEGMTFGNIIFGGIVGVGIDAASGAMNKYPPSVTVQLAPVSFPSASARDAFFDQKIAALRVRHEQTKATTASQCSADENACKSRLSALDRILDADVADLELKRANARVDGA